MRIPLARTLPGSKITHRQTSYQPGTGAMLISQLDHLVLRVSDRAAMLHFYRDILGLAVAHEQPDLGLTHLRAGSVFIDLITIDGPLGREGGAAPGSEARNLDHL